MSTYVMPIGLVWFLVLFLPFLGYVVGRGSHMWVRRDPAPPERRDAPVRVISLGTPETPAVRGQP